MARRSKTAKDRTSVLIAIVLHVLLIGGAAYWAYKTGKLEQIRQVLLQYVKPDKKEKKEEPKPIQPKAPPAKLPPINQGVPQAGSGTRRAVASDAPPASGGSSFFQDTRRQVQGPSTSGQPAASKPSPPRVVPAPAVPRPAFRPPPASTIKQLLTYCDQVISGAPVSLVVVGRFLQYSIDSERRFPHLRRRRAGLGGHGRWVAFFAAGAVRSRFDHS
ncbi:MAG: hypothetical protein HY735_10545 [Verrucomicrobia bacterium]|nr:hypothetical protein [Verrucomicrobiota bacterium]